MTTLSVAASQQARVIRELALANGLHLLPQALFQPHGRLRPLSELQQLLLEQRQRLAVRPTLRPPQDEVRRRLRLWRNTERIARQRPDDGTWFHVHFGFAPSSVEEVLGFLLAANSKNLHWFLDSSCWCPWSDLHRLLALMRLEHIG